MKEAGRMSAVVHVNKHKARNGGMAARCTFRPVAL